MFEDIRQFSRSFIHNPTDIRISKIRATNYRVFKSGLEMEIKPITLIFGGNSAGKSSILKLLDYINAVSLKKSWSLNGTFNPLNNIYQKNPNSTIQYSVELDVKYTTKIEVNNTQKHQSKFEVSIELMPVSVESIYDILKQKEEVYNEFDELNLDEISKYLFVEKSIRITEINPESSEKKIIIDLEFAIQNNTLVLEKGEINPETNYLFNFIEGDDTENLVERINKNVNNYKKIFFESVDDYKASFKDVIKDLTLFYIDQDYLFENSVWGFRPKLGQFKFTSTFIYRLSSAFGSIENGKISINKNLLNQYPGKSEKRKVKQYTRRIAVLNHAFTTMIFELLENAFKNKSIYLEGVREFLSDEKSFGQFLGVKESIWGDNEINKHDDDSLGEINRVLGQDSLDLGYKIVYKEGITPKEVQKLKHKLNKKGFDSTKIDNFFLNEGLNYRYELIDCATNTEVKHSEVGRGIVQVIPIIANTIINQGGMFIIEQPELHLHPGQQSKLASYLANSSKTFRNNYLIETHSEHFIKTIQLEVARFISTNGNEGIDPKDVQILYVFKDKNLGESKIREIRLSRDGSFTEPWPDDFFDSAADITMERLRLTHRN